MSNNHFSHKIPLNHPSDITVGTGFKPVPTPNLEKSILSTIVYYDCMDYPLTLVEIFRYLIVASFPNVIARSEATKQSRGLSAKHGKSHISAGRRTDSAGLSASGGSAEGMTSSACWPPRNDKQKNAAEKIQFFDILETLETGEALKKIIDQKNGFYFLRGRKNIVETRLMRKKLADEKWKKMKPVLTLCQAIPYIRAIFISGSLALGNTKKESDIDILVVAKHGHIWTARAFLTVFLSLLGKYRQANSTADKICANHYITDKSLAIPFRSLYNAQTYAHFFAADAASNEYIKKFKGENGWTKDYLIFFDPQEDKNMHNVSVGKSLRLSFFATLRKILELTLDNSIGKWLENKFKDFESSRIKKSNLYDKSGGRITISDEQLEFHPDSPEKAIVEKFNVKMRGLGFPDLANLEDSGLTP